MTGPFERLYWRIEEKEIRVRLGRFFRYASLCGLTPDAVTTQAFDRFLEALTSSGDPQAKSVDRAARKAWNAAVQSILDWPQRPVDVPSYVDHYTLPLEAFPPSFGQDIAAYLASRTKNKSTSPLDDLSLEELFDDLPRQGERHHGPIRESTANLIGYRFRQFASILVNAGKIKPDEINGIGSLVQVPLVKAGLEIMIGRAGEARNSQIFGVATDLAIVARFWIKRPDKECDTLDRFADKLRPRHTGLPESARRALAPLKDPQNIRSFLKLPERVFADLLKLKKPSSVDANRAAAALWIAIVQRIPLRISNLCKIDIERNIIRSHAGKGGRMSLYFRPDEVKNDVVLEAPLSEPVSAMLETYLERYRPLLLKAPSTVLFPDQKGRPKRPNTMSRSVQDLMADRIGFAFNPHSFRHVAAMLYLKVNPGDYVRVQLMLGHKRLETTIKYYCDLRTEEAFAHFDEAILKLAQE